MADPLRWDDLRTFLAIARGGTLAAAAEGLGVNASTVHRRIAALEGALSAELFRRDPRGYALTSVGEALVPRAEEVEEAVLALSRAATGHDRSARGPVSITMPETLFSIVAPAVAAVCAVCPGLRPIVRLDDRMLDLGQDADLALRPSPEPPTTAHGRKIGVVAWAVYARRGTPKGSRWVIYASGHGPALATRWRHTHRPDVEVLAEVSSVGAMQTMLASADAFGLLPCYVGDPDPRVGRETEIIDDATTDLWLLIHADLRRSARVRALIDLLVPQLEAQRDLLAGLGRERDERDSRGTST